LFISKKKKVCNESDNSKFGYIDERGRVVIPFDIRRNLKIYGPQNIEFRVKENKLILIPIDREIIRVKIKTKSKLSKLISYLEEKNIKIKEMRIEESATKIVELLIYCNRKKLSRLIPEMSQKFEIADLWI